MKPQAHARLEFHRVENDHPAKSFSSIVEEGLSAPQKSLPSRYFYDSRGSELFERITQLPEYYVTRTEQSILDQFADEICEAMPGPIEMVEFGSGSSAKTRTLLNAALHHQNHLCYLPIDISADFLRESSESLLEEYPNLSIKAIAAEYSDGISHLPEPSGPRMVLFLGSNIGNFETTEAINFLAEIRSNINPEDRVLVGIDLVKERQVLLEAYNDEEGVTAAFNKNVLGRINRELCGRFDLDKFEHFAPFNEQASRIEMHLISAEKQSVYVEGLDQTFTFEKGESIHTENSHKYTEPAFETMAAKAGLRMQNLWRDPHHWFALTLLAPITGG